MASRVLSTLLSLLLILATLDKIPDPAAASPRSDLASVAYVLNHHVADIATSLAIAPPLPLPARAAGPGPDDSFAYLNQLVPIEQASDPSPPASRS